MLLTLDTIVNMHSEVLILMREFIDDILVVQMVFFRQRRRTVVHADRFWSIYKLLSYL